MSRAPAKARSRHRQVNPIGYTGPLPDGIWPLIETCWLFGLAVSSNKAREASTEVALAASMGWISTVSLDGQGYGRMWNVTAEGTAAYTHRRMLTKT